MAAIRSFRELRVYQRAYQAALRVYEFSKRFPAEERFSLTDQIRRSSRSVCANIGEGWRKRRYEKSFVFKLSDADGEACETTIWLDFAQDHGFITKEEHEELTDVYDHIEAELTNMMTSPHKWCKRD